MFLMTLRRLEVRLLINTEQRGAKGEEWWRGAVARTEGWRKKRTGRWKKQMIVKGEKDE